MHGKLARYSLVTIVMTSLLGSAKAQMSAGGLREFDQRAAKYNSIITLPQFETTTNDVAMTLRQTITNGNVALDQIGALQPKQVNFKNTVVALDDASYQIG